MDQATFFDNIGKIMVFLLVLFTIFLLTVKTKKKLSNYLFAAFIIVTIFDFVGLFLGEEIAQRRYLQDVKVASTLLQMPLFFSYVLSVCYSDFRLRWRNIFHALPFAAFVIIFWGDLFPNSDYDIYEVVGELQYFAYIIAIFWTLSRHKKVYLENFSNPDYTDYKWLFQATSLFVIGHMFVLARTVIRYSGANPQWMTVVNTVVSIFALLVTCLLVMKALYRPQIFAGIATQLKPLKPSTDPSDTSQQNEKVERLRSFMDGEKPYLDSELSLERLANSIPMEEKELSSLINHHIGKHFFDFINEYRIEAAKSLLRNPDKSDLTILEILYAVGFNSKSSFYTSFKKEVGQTPIKYRKSIG